MKLDREHGTGNLIHRFTGSEIHVAGQIFRQPVIVTLDRLISGWSPPPVALLDVQDLQVVLDLAPDVILLGTGPRQVFPPPILAATVLRQGVGIEIMDTAAACRTFNILAAELRRVAAALYVE
jgi:uncharacterized protein